MWLCECLECGDTIICCGSELRAGKRTSCGKRCNTTISEIGNVYDYLTVIDKDPTPASSFADHCVHWICKCKCGNIVSVTGRTLRNGTRKSCGCMGSQGEAYIRFALTELGLPHQKEYSFDDLRSEDSHGKLRFDYAVFDNENKDNILFLIEYQGPHHDYEIPYFSHSLEWYQSHDKMKQEYCNKHHIPLFCIYHNKGKVPDYPDIKKLIKNKYEEIQNEILNQNN